MSKNQPKLKTLIIGIVSLFVIAIVMLSTSIETSDKADADKQLTPQDNAQEITAYSEDDIQEVLNYYDFVFYQVSEKHKSIMDNWTDVVILHDSKDYEAAKDGVLAWKTQFEEQLGVWGSDTFKPEPIQEAHDSYIKGMQEIVTACQNYIDNTDEAEYENRLSDISRLETSTLSDYIAVIESIYNDYTYQTDLE